MSGPKRGRAPVDALSSDSLAAVSSSLSSEIALQTQAESPLRRAQVSARTLFVESFPSGREEDPEYQRPGG